MATINKLFFLLALCSCLYCSCQYYDLAPYRDELFAIERFVVFDSVMATYGDNITGKHPEFLLENCFLVTGYADTIEAEKKIDSMLLSLINPAFIEDMRTYPMYFFKKARKYNNDYARVTREFAYTTNTNGSFTFYAKGVDRYFFPPVNTPENAALDYIFEKLAFNGADGLWSSFQDKIVDYVNSRDGSAVKQDAIMKRPKAGSAMKELFKQNTPITNSILCD